MKHYVLGSNKGLLASPKPAAKRVSWSMGFASLTCAAAVYIAYLGFEEPSRDAKLPTHTKLNPAALGSVASKAGPSVWGGKGCSAGSLNPFANRVECDAAVEVQIAAEQASNGQEVANHSRAMIRNAIGGDVSQLESYWKYSINCRKQPNAAGNKDPGCAPDVLKANDALFVMAAETLAARGDTQAQLALGQWWLGVAMVPAAAQSPEVLAARRESAYFLSQAAPQSLEAQKALMQLASIGVGAQEVVVVQ